MEENLLLGRRLKETFIFLGISNDQQSSLETYLNLIKLKDKSTYYHCIRVALYGTKVAELLHLDHKAMFYSGLLHDVGKVLVDKELLSKVGDFSEHDHKKMKRHSLYGYYLLRGVHDFSAEIIVRHHKYTSRSYPEKLPHSSLVGEEIERYARILAIIDFYDAAVTRNNGKFSSRDVKTLLVQHFPKETDIINLCFKRGIFS